MLVSFQVFSTNDVGSTENTHTSSHIQKLIQQIADLKVNSVLAKKVRNGRFLNYNESFSTPGQRELRETYYPPSTLSVASNS